MVDEIFLETEENMQKAIESLQYELARIMTGRANPNMLDSVRVDYYGALTPLNQLASISTPEANQLLVKPYDKNVVKEVEKAIATSDLGVNPNNECEQIRIIFPKLDEERRKELVKQSKKIAEDARVKVRNARREANERIKKLEKSGDISEDASNGHQEEVQKLTDDYIAKIDAKLAEKEKDLTEV